MEKVLNHEEIFRWWRGHGSASPLPLTGDEMAGALESARRKFGIDAVPFERLHGVLKERVKLCEDPR